MKTSELVLSMYELSEPVLCMCGGTTYLLKCWCYELCAMVISCDMYLSHCMQWLCTRIFLNMFDYFLIFLQPFPIFLHIFPKLLDIFLDFPDFLSFSVI
jgi:hypothetical protein